MKNLKRVFSEFIEFAGYTKFFFFVFVTIFVAAVAMLEPIFMARTIGFLEDFQKTGNFLLTDFLLFLAIWWGYLLFNMFLNYVHRYFISDKTALEFHNAVAIKYVKNLYFMHYGDFLAKKSGSVYKDFDRGMDAFFRVVFFFFLTFIKVIMSFVVALTIMMYFNWKMTILALAMLPFMAIVGLWIARKTDKPQEENNKRWTDAFGYIGNFFSNMQLGKILRLEEAFRSKFVQEISEALRLQKFTSRWWSASDMITSVFVGISRFLVIGFGVYFIMQGELTIAGLILTFSYLERIYFPLSSLFGSLPDLQRWEVEVGIFYDTVEKSRIEKLDEGQKFEPKNGEIIFENVNFGYSDERKIFENLNFSIFPGQKVALVGNTGAGKTTIVSLLFRFWDPNSGKIVLDGQNIAGLKKSQLRAHIGMVSQDNSLFNLTIRENLLFAKPDASDEEIKIALQKASADFVWKLEKGIETMIGERGLKLSGGEKQRLSIARLFLQNPQILVLDEATSALDNKTEKNIQQSLDALMKGKTAIIIAHRLSTIKNVDKILMIENGKIVESGTYDELVARGGKFAELANPDRLVIS